MSSAAWTFSPTATATLVVDTDVASLHKGTDAVEASKIAGHANTKITEEYTIVQLRRQEEFTRRIRDKGAKAAKRSQKGL